MIVYSVTVTLDTQDGPDWEAYMLEKHMDDVVNTGCFTHAELRKVVDKSPGKVSYVGEYFAPNRESLDRYYAEYAATMRQDALSRFEGKIHSERKVYELIQAS